MDQAEYYRTHLPRCIAGFSAVPADVPGWRYDGHASAGALQAKFPGVQIQGPAHINAVFQLLCSCGSSRHRVTAYAWSAPDRPGEFLFLSPMSVQCSACGKSCELIDTDVHGYDAELGNGSATRRAEGNREEVECGGCDLNKDMEVFVRFEYPDDLFDEFEDYAGRQQDLFTWFSLLGRCSKCSALLPIAEFECA